MVNYNNGKIYKIEPSINCEEGDIYIGSTTKQYLSQRFVKHRDNYKRFKEGKYGYTSSFDLFEKYGIDNCKILLIENVAANSKDELVSREAYYIKTLQCVNKRIPHGNREEYLKDWYEKNKLTKSEKSKAYYLENKDQIDARNKKYNEENKEKLKLYHKNWYKNNCK